VPPEDLLVSDPTVQEDATCFELGLLGDRYVLVAAVLNQEVVSVPRRFGVPVDAYRGFQFAGVESTVLNENSFNDSAAGTVPELEKNPRALARTRTEIEASA
jgi:hypothetical protein